MNQKPIVRQSTMHATCPHCDVTYEISDDLEGRSLKCAHCGTFFRARLNRAAIKVESRKEPEKPWPTKLPTLAPTRQPLSESTTRIIFYTIAAVIAVCLIGALAYVYSVNSPDNILIDRGNRSTPTSGKEVN
ncbi:MAG TPA: zinc-ribbon domain-containing protein [Pirellulaceae bacterium]|nr:zinc-ribbon domain-containing protein [Pirellulaceae bacterium]HMO91884.1 zinc-ribbon domain-containing protein [Pirellulaceae bacterium]HMP69706.1 zinc-ribbon domain-containing protein [Pirellulaceae bacterium]